MWAATTTITSPRGSLMGASTAKQDARQHTCESVRPHIKFRNMQNISLTQRLEKIYEWKLTAQEALKKSLLNEAFTGKL